MCLIRSVLTVGSALMLVLTVSAAPIRPPAVRGRGINSAHAIEGIVVAVHHDRLAVGSGWIEVRRAASGRARAVKFAVTPATVFEQRIANGRRRPASFLAVRPGERVRIRAATGTARVAREVVIQSHRRVYHRRSYGNRGYVGRNSFWSRSSGRHVGVNNRARHPHGTVRVKR